MKIFFRLAGAVALSMVFAATAHAECTSTTDANGNTSVNCINTSVTQGVVYGNNNTTGEGSVSYTNSYDPAQLDNLLSQYRSRYQYTPRVTYPSYTSLFSW